MEKHLTATKRRPQLQSPLYAPRTDPSVPATVFKCFTEESITIREDSRPVCACILVPRKDDDAAVLLHTAARGYVCHGGIRVGLRLDLDQCLWRNTQSPLPSAVLGSGNDWHTYLFRFASLRSFWQHSRVKRIQKCDWTSGILTAWMVSVSVTEQFPLGKPEQADANTRGH